MSRRWNGSVWSEAGQVRALLGWPPAAELDALPLDACFERLRRRRTAVEATFFLGVALPRYEAVLWAAQAVQELLAAPEAAAMTAVAAWLRDPSEPRRRATEAFARMMRQPTPERLCAWGAFMAGGSIAPVDAPPHLAPPDATGRFAAAAVIAAALPHGDTALQAVLDAGARMAETRELAA